MDQAGEKGQTDWAGGSRIYSDAPTAGLVCPMAIISKAAVCEAGLTPGGPVVRAMWHMEGFQAFKGETPEVEVSQSKDHNKGWFLIGFPIHIYPRRPLV